MTETTIRRIGPRQQSISCFIDGRDNGCHHRFMHQAEAHAALLAHEKL